MKVGIISDTHDNLDAIDATIELLNSKEVGTVIHAGDVISPFAAARFKRLKAPMWVVYGNNDGERTGLKSKFKELGAEIEDFLEFELGGRRFAVYHGTIEGVQDSLVKSRQYDVVLTGHTHKPEVKRSEGTLLINPGEACGYLTGKRSLCILDLETMEPEIVEY
ncbi:MAG: metallophosphoesterase [Candidatus Hydrothermarchaeales archaeon]